VASLEPFSRQSSFVLVDFSGSIANDYTESETKCQRNPSLTIGLGIETAIKAFGPEASWAGASSLLAEQYYRLSSLRMRPLLKRLKVHKI